VRLCVEALRSMIDVAPLVYLNRHDSTDDLHHRNRTWLAERDGLQVSVGPLDALDALAGASHRNLR
jgi:hypothetical protein